MSTDSFGERRRVLEESFFDKRNRELLENLRGELAADDTRKQLAAATGISDGKLLDELVAAKIHPETLAALTLVPLVQVAWANGKVEADEREAIAKAAAEAGIASAGAAGALLESWLTVRPDEKLFQAWKDYVGELEKNLDASAHAAIKRDITGRAKQVAQSAGGFLGYGSISPSEQKALDEIEAAFLENEMAEPLATCEHVAGDVNATLEFLKRTRNELRTLRKARVFVDRVQVFDVNGDYFEVQSLGYGDAEVVPVLMAVHTVFKPESIHNPIPGEYKEFKTGRRRAWAEDRVM